MKRYIQIMLIALVAQCGLSNVMYGMNKNENPDVLVNEIKYHSDLTKADENQYKLLWLGNLGNYGAFIAGAASTIGAGAKVYQKAGLVQNITPKASIGAGISSYQKSGMGQSITLANVSSWMTNPLVLAGLGSLGASYVSYKMLYPRVRAGVISKVQKLIDYCETLNQDSASHGHTILNWRFTNFLELQQYLPQRWSSHSNKAVYNALSNLLDQAIVAKALLEQVGIDTETQDMYNRLVGYISSLSTNKGLYAPVAQWEEQQVAQHEHQKQHQELQLANLQANTALQQQGAGLTQAKTAETYLQMITNIIRDGWNGINYIYKKKYHIAAIAGAGYAYAKGWFGGK